MVASPYLLKIMGINFSREMLYNNPDPEQKLWRAVIINAFDETLIYQTDRKSSLIKMNAHNWILSDNYAFDQVCDWAEVDKEIIRYSYKEACKNKIVRFNTKHVAWKKYDVKYKIMMQERNDKLRNKIRKNILMYRRSILTMVGETMTTVLDSVVS